MAKKLRRKTNPAEVAEMVLLSRELKEIRARAATATESERAELEYRETEIQRRYYDLARGSDPDTITEGIEYTVAHYLAADSAGFDATRRADLVYAGVATILRRGPRRGQREFCQFMEGYAAGYGDGLAREKDATGRHVLRPEVAPGERPPLVLRLHPAPEPRPRSRR